jgi:uncharacterized membrane protein
MKQHIPFLLPKSDEVWGLNDSAARSLVKTVTWRVTGSTATFLIAYAMTGNFAVAGVIGLTQMISNTILYYIHERAWNRIAWGAK